MLETTVSDGLEEFWLQKHILEGSAVDTSVGGGLGGSGSATILSGVFKVVLENVVLVVGQVGSGGGFTVNHCCLILVLCSVYGNWLVLDACVQMMSVKISGATRRFITI